MVLILETTVNERVIDAFYELLKQGRVKNKSAFAKAGDFLATYWTGYEQGTRKVSIHVLSNLSSHFGLNFTWLAEGKGAMFFDQAEKSASYDAHGLTEVLSPTGTSNARRIPVDRLNIRVLPYLPIGARAGIAEHYADDVHKYSWENAETLAVLDVPDTKEFTEAIIVDVNGDSMEPTLKDGSKVVVTPVQQGNWQYLNSGIYCVIYAGNFVIKRIKDNTLLENGILRLHSDNPQGGSFPVKADDIRAIWRVRWAAYVPI